jgi:mono/diheme cytochrome c family protein
MLDLPVPGPLRGGATRSAQPGAAGQEAPNAQGGQGMRAVKLLLGLFVVLLVGGAAFIWFGLYNVAADEPHWRLTHRIIETARERSVRVRAAAIEAPELDDAELVRGGAGNYDAMCTGCHLRPGAADTELSIGLYPVPPPWSELDRIAPREAFWVIKHGVKASGMPAWGISMDDRYVWGMVAFIQKLPSMTPAEYRAMVAASPGHSHGGGETDLRSEAADVRPRSSFEPIGLPSESPTDASAAHRHERGHSH